MSIKELIKNRTSVRTYDGRGLTQEDRDSLRDYVSALTNPFGVPVEFKILNAKENQLSSAVIVGEEEYLAAKVRKSPHYEMAFGYSFEKACLFALSRGISTIMLAASLSRSTFEKAMDLKSDEVFPLASPVGYAAEKKSIRENLMRKALKADERKPFENLFFDGSFDRGLNKENAGIFAEALEYARWSPSAGNGQPWRAVVEGNKVHFYEYGPQDSALGDVKKLDVGIAIAHFEGVLEEEGITGTYSFDDPGIAAPEKVVYLTTFEAERSNG